MCGFLKWKWNCAGFVNCMLISVLLLEMQYSNGGVSINQFYPQHLFNMPVPRPGDLPEYVIFTVVLYGLWQRGGCVRFVDNGWIVV